MAALGIILNAVHLIAVIAAPVIWIVALCKWDGKCPCEPEDCEDCPYSGTGCEIDPQTKSKADTDRKKG